MIVLLTPLGRTHHVDPAQPTYTICNLRRPAPGWSATWRRYPVSCPDCQERWANHRDLEQPLVPAAERRARRRQRQALRRVVQGEAPPPGQDADRQRIISAASPSRWRRIIAAFARGRRMEA